MSKKISRRDFLKTGTGTIAALGTAATSFSLFDGILNAQTSPRSTVVIAHDPQAIDNRNQCNADIVSRMLNRSLMALTTQTTPAQAWTTLGLSPNDVVAIKVNCNTWTVKLTPHNELVNALCQSLGLVIPLNNIIFYERTTSDLISGGFTSNRGKTGVRYFGNDQANGYDEKQRLTRIVTDLATKIINLASLKCIEGDLVASLFFKNHIGTLPDEDMPKCHGNPDFLAEVNSRPAIAQKTLLNLCDALRGTYRRGVPWYPAALVMGKDPVASEYAAFELINKKRQQEKIAPLEVPEHLLLAQNKYKLGNCTPSRIQILELK